MKEKLKNTWGKINENKIDTLILWLVLLVAVCIVAVIADCGRDEQTAMIQEPQVIEVYHYVTIINEVEEPEIEYEGMTFKTTGYCNCRKCCGKWSGGATASGVMPVAGVTVAVDPDVIPLGTKLLVDGKEYIAQDTGSAIKGNILDIYYDSHEEAWNHGVQYQQVVVLE